MAHVRPFKLTDTHAHVHDTHVHTHAHTHLHAHVHHTYMHTCTHIHICIHTYARTHARMLFYTHQSPTSLKVTHRQQIKGASMSFKDCIKMEYRISLLFKKKYIYAFQILTKHRSNPSTITTHPYLPPLDSYVLQQIVVM